MDYSQLRPSDPRRLEARDGVHDPNAVAAAYAIDLGLDQEHFGSPEHMRHLVSAELRNYGMVVTAFEAITGWHYTDHRQLIAASPTTGVIGYAAHQVYEQPRSDDVVEMMEDELRLGRMLITYGSFSWDRASIILRGQDPMSPDSAIAPITEMVAKHRKKIIQFQQLVIPSERYL